MDVFNQPYYKLNKLYLSSVGQWPYDSTVKRHAIIAVITLCTFTDIAAKINDIMTTYKDTDLLFDSLPPVIGNIAIVISMVTYIVKIDELKQLLDYIKFDWGAVKTEEESKLLHRYAEQGRRVTKYYSHALLIAMAIFMITPVAPRLLRIGNMSAPRPLPNNVNYFVDNEEYYYPILLHDYVAVTMLMAGLIAADTMFFVFVQHACGMFSIIEYKLEHLMENKNLEKNLRLPINDDVCFYTMRECIQQHVNVLRFTKIMEMLYQRTFFLQAGINMILMSITAVRIASVLNSPQVAFRMFSYSLAQLSHLVMECHQGQQLIDHSFRIQHGHFVNCITSQCLLCVILIILHSMNSTWYLTSFRTRKLIHFMMMTSQVPSVLTAGKLFVISMEFCSLVVRTSVTYFTVLRSLK